MRAVEQVLNGWGNFTPCPSRVFRPDRLRELLRLLNDPPETTWIARGLGRSYGDSALNRDGGTLLLDQINHLTEFDPATGTLTCEAGVSFAELIDVFLPRGWFLPVTPGTKFVTVGGAIAADVHGKNHHVDGTFGQFVESLDLLTASGSVLTCSPQEHPEIFWATVGGMGLTGIILRARFRLLPVESAYIHVDYRKAQNLDQAFDLFQEGDRAYRYSVAWIDCLASGESLGRSVLMRGDHAPAADLSSRKRRHPFLIHKKRPKTIPFHFPAFALNPWSVKAFNTLYYARHSDGRKLVDYNSFFYPLDGVLHWNRMYGRRGFVQYQALFPPESSRAGMRALLESIAQSRMASFLAVLKSTGDANQGLLSFPKPGHTLALDLPNAGQRLTKLLERLDAIVLDHGGRLYLAKDATMTKDTFARMYDKLDTFREIRRQVDPLGRFTSAQARRLGIVGEVV